MDLLFSQIPTTIQTVEQLHAWSGLLLHRSNSTLKVLEAANYSDYACQNSLFTADDGTERLVLRINLKLDPEYAAGTEKIWNLVEAFSDVAIPTAYLS